MLGDIGAPELLILLAIVVVLFGAGRVGKVGKDLGTAVKDFRSALKDDETEKADAKSQSMLPVPPAGPAAPAAPATPAEPEANRTGQKPPALF